MMANFNDFMIENPNCSKFFELADVKELFELISKDENIIKMIEKSDAKKSALLGCLAEIEEWYEKKESCEIDLHDDFTKTMVGRMIKTILAPFAYYPVKQKDIPAAYSKKYFASASCYAYKEEMNPTMKIEKTITYVRKPNSEMKDKGQAEQQVTINQLCKKQNMQKINPDQKILEKLREKSIDENGNISDVIMKM